MIVRTPFHCVLLVATAACCLSAQTPDLQKLKDEAIALADGRAKMTQVIVDTVFSFGEIGYQEVETSKFLTALLEKEGFRITRGVAGMPTAFVAEWGSGKPVIGFMADIDGLPETSQKPGVAYREPIVKGAPGHGEGHNSGLAVGATAAIVVKELMQKHKIPGTLRVYPGVAEELLGSRTYMVNAGLFRDVDAMLSSHISSSFSVSGGPSGGNGLVSVLYSFHGTSAHSAGSPWAGRSALDAVELMNTGWNYRREHLGLSQRSHYVIVNGGSQPNVVPSEASVWYYFRERSYEGIKGLHEIGSTIARAAAQMTGTSVEERVLAATWPGHFSVPIAEAANRNISRVGLPSWSEDDQKFAKAVQTLMGAPTRGLAAKLLPERAGEGGEGGPSGEPGRAAAAGAAGSDDIAEVSWNVPTIQLRYPGNISGAIGHHWSSAMAMATPIAHKGATAGAKVHAMNALDLLLNPELMKAAKEYFDKQTKETKWQSLIPAGVQPYLDMHKERMEKYRPEMRKYYFDSSKYGTYLEQLGIKYPMLDAPKQP